MKYRTLGRTGVRVSNLCLGTMMFGTWGNKDHDESIRVVHRALDAGINMIDTADLYSHGEAETIVGKALAGGRRDNVVLASKFHNPMGDDVNARGNSRRWIVQAVENSLRRLQTDHLDLYQVHRPDPDTDIEETLGALTDLQRAGKIHTSVQRRTPHTNSSPPNGPRNAEISAASSPSNLHTHCSHEESKPTFSPSHNNLHSESWSGVRSAGAGFPVHTEWAPRTLSATETSSCPACSTSPHRATRASWTPPKPSHSLPRNSASRSFISHLDSFCRTRQ